MASIKEVYSAVEKDKENEPSSGIYSMPLQDFIDEHTKLIKILREGSRDELLSEANDQEKELKKCLKEHKQEMPSDDDEGEED